MLLLLTRVISIIQSQFYRLNRFFFSNYNNLQKKNNLKYNILFIISPTKRVSLKIIIH